MDYVALRPIFYYGVRAYNPGDPVPAANVDANGYVIGEDVAEPDTADVDTDTGPVRPAGNASTEEWADYAAQLAAAGSPLGLTPEQSDGMTRSEIIAHVDGQRG